MGATTGLKWDWTGLDWTHKCQKSVNNKPLDTKLSIIMQKHLQQMMEHGILRISKILSCYINWSLMLEC